MLIVKQNTQIGTVKFNSFVEFSTTDSVDNVGQSGTITVPKQLNLDGFNISDLFKRGTDTSVSLGYNDTVIERFRGVLKTVQIDRPIVFELSGYDWFLSQTDIKKSFSEGVSSKDIIEYLVNEVNSFFNKDFDVEITADFKKLPEQRYSNVSALQIISNLRKEYGIYSYFRGDTLYSGLKYPEFEDKESFKFYLNGENCNVISNDLKYEVSEDVKVLVKATSYITKDNKLKKITVEVGDKGGRTIPYQGYNLTEDQLKVKAKNKIEEYKKDGYTGSFVTFGLPAVNHGDVIETFDREFPERNGRYLAKSVETTCTVSGGLRQKIDLDLKV